MALFDKKPEPTAQELRAHLQERQEIAAGNFRIMNAGGHSEKAAYYARTANWLEFAIEEVDDFLSARSASEHPPRA